MGCLPPACWPYPRMHWAGGSLPVGVSVQGGVYPGGLCSGGVCPRGCLPLVPGLGVCIPACNGAGTPPRGQTDTCENITMKQHENETWRKEREYGYFLCLAYGNPRTKFVQIQKFFWNKRRNIRSLSRWKFSIRHNLKIIKIFSIAIIQASGGSLVGC